MQAVILAAGRGTRMGKLTETTPKPMLKVAGKPILEYIFDSLPEEITEVIFVVGYLQDVIKKHFGDSRHGKNIRYVEQANVKGGTADALWQARPYLSGKFVVMNGDDIYQRDDIRACLAHEWAILAMQTSDLESAAKVIVQDGVLTNIIEADEHDGGEGLANVALYVLDERIFGYTPVPKAADSSELGLPQTILQAAKTIPIHVVEATGLLRFTAPEDIARAEEALKGGKK